MTDSEKRVHARKLNMARRHMTQEQRRELIREQLAETPEKSDRQIAAGLGVSDKTVGSQRKEMERCAEIPHVEKTVDTLGRIQPRKPVTVFTKTGRNLPLRKSSRSDYRPPVRRIAQWEYPEMDCPVGYTPEIRAI